MSDIDVKLSHLLEFSNMCVPEYNMPELSDRILVIDIMQDGWEAAGILNNISLNLAKKRLRHWCVKI